jgi:hypothetical protein
VIKKRVYIKINKKSKISLVLKNHGTNTHGEMPVKLQEFLISALDTSGQLHDQAALSPIPTGKKPGWTPELDAMANQNVPVPYGNKFPVVQPVVSYFTD